MVVILSSLPSIGVSQNLGVIINPDHVHKSKKMQLHYFQTKPQGSNYKPE